MRLDPAEHRRHGWWILDHARGFELLDVWQYPIEAERAEDFERFVAIHDLRAMVAESSMLVRALFAMRMLAGKLFGWDRAGIGFTEVHRDGRELVLGTENRTVTALLHLGWVALPRGRWTAQLAVYAIPHGRLGRVYLKTIAPFRHRVVYPALMRAGKRRWERASAPPP